MAISQPILISPLPLPPASCWREILKLLDGQSAFPAPLLFLKLEPKGGCQTNLEPGRKRAGPLKFNFSPYFAHAIG